MGDRWLYYALCTWAGVSLAMAYVHVLGRMPGYLEVLAVGFIVQRYIDTVTIPFLEKNRVMFPLVGYRQMIGACTRPKECLPKDKTDQRQIAKCGVESYGQ